MSGAVGAGFASGREIVRFFAVHGAMAGIAGACALASLAFFFLRLCAQLEHAGCTSLDALCRVRFGKPMGGLCRLLFVLLGAVTAGAMLSACAEIGALALPVRSAYGFTLIVSLILGIICAHRGVKGLALPGMALCALLPALLLRLLAFKEIEASFLPAMTPDLPVRAAADGVVYGALNAALLAGMLPALLGLTQRQRKRAVALFSLLFALLLSLGVLVCRRHLPEIRMQPMPFVHLGRALGRGGYPLLCACLYAAALSTLCAMLLGLMHLLPLAPPAAALSAAALALLFARIGFAPLVQSGYPALGTLCAGLLAALCLPGCPHAEDGAKESG